MKKRIGLLVALMVFALALSASANWTWTEGRDGIRVYYPASGWTWTEGADGHRVVHPISGWTWTEGKNGRRVIYPTNGWTWTEDSRGGRIVYPLNGWTWTEGRDGIRVIYPMSGWTWTEGRDGHRIVYPMSGWTWREDPNGRRVAYPTNGDLYARVEDLLYSLLINKIPLTDATQQHAYLLMEQMGIEYAGGTADPELRRAHYLLNLNDFYGARDLFRSLARMGSSDRVRREAAYMVGYCSANLKDFWQGIQEFRDFMAQYDVAYDLYLVPEALYVLGNLNEHVGRKSDAADSYRACVSRFPNTQVANQSRERLAVLAGSRDARDAVAVADSRKASPVTVNTFGEAGMLRRNPFEVVKVNTGQIARVCQFIRSVDKMSGVEEALEKLTTADEQLGTVQKYMRILAEKQHFNSLHQGVPQR